jgi:ABC-type glycerol-3-phosphate transport system substrate-binding protein/ribosomal protein S8
MRKIFLVIYILLAIINFSNLTELSYFEQLKKWNGINNAVGVEITPSASYITLNKYESFSFYIDIPIEGLYNIELTYNVLSDDLLENEIDIKINDEYQFFESRRIVLPQFWKSKSDFLIDRYGNQIVPEQSKLKKETIYLLKDAANLEEYPLLFFLKKGKNKIQITLNSGRVLINKIKIISPTKEINYEKYKLTHNIENNKDTLIILEAEKPDYKNDTAINPISSRDLEVNPYSTNNLLLNVLGGDSWSKSGQEVFYKFHIKKDGFYYIGFKYLQNLKPNSNVFRTIKIDNKILFKEMKNVKFSFTTKWKIIKWNYPIYLEKGDHILSLEANAYLYGNLINSIYYLINEINNIALDFKKLTGGNSANKNIEWDVLNYFPNIQKTLNNYKDELEKIYVKALKLNDNRNNSEGLIALDTAIKNIKFLANNPDLIPKRYSLLNEGSNSIVTKLSIAITEFQRQPLILDQIYILNNEKKLPQLKISLSKRFIEGFKRFIYSFKIKDNYSNKGKVLKVWVNRSRNYVNLIQSLADTQFTPKTGIKVDISLMPNEQKLILSYASKTAPDIALGISNWLPFELGIRGAALDLRRFDDFGKVITRFSPGALLPYIYEQKCFALPETQDFYVLFYRKDIFEKLKLPIPNTWDDVKKILPELQRYGMNFYLPIAGAGGFKPFMTTAPFIYQNDGRFYSDDGFKTALNEPNSLKGIELMTKLFTLYGVQLQIPNFFEHFRSSLSPIGISNFTTYLQLMVGAPELKNSWDIALSPGVKNGNIIERWQTGSAQSAMVFNTTKYPNEAWEFLKWWTSEKTQTDFGQRIQTLYGKEFMWNSANIKAFSKIPIPDEHKKIILEQWEWLKEVPKTPAGYMTERELSNIWIKVVLQGKNLRASVDDSVNKINKEIQRKLEEFGYIKNGKKIKNYYIPKFEDVLKWRLSNE